MEPGVSVDALLPSRDMQNSSSSSSNNTTTSPQPSWSLGLSTVSDTSKNGPCSPAADSTAISRKSIASLNTGTSPSHNHTKSTGSMAGGTWSGAANDSTTAAVISTERNENSPPPPAPTPKPHQNSWMDHQDERKNNTPLLVVSPTHDDGSKASTTLPMSSPSGVTAASFPSSHASSALHQIPLSSLSSSTAAATTTTTAAAVDDGLQERHQQQQDNHPSPKKGGHSLRKRTRVDYTFEHIEDEPVVPNSTSSAASRTKRRRVGFNDDFEDFSASSTTPSSKRRGTSLGAESPTSRRRNPSRRASELRSWKPGSTFDVDQMPIQDTIEVGGMSSSSYLGFPDADYAYQHHPQPQLPPEPVPLEQQQPPLHDQNGLSYPSYYQQDENPQQLPWDGLQQDQDLQGAAAPQGFPPTTHVDISHESSLYPTDPDTQLQDESYQAQLPVKEQSQTRESTQPLDPALFGDVAPLPQPSTQTQKPSDNLTQPQVDQGTETKNLIAEPAQREIQPAETHDVAASPKPALHGIALAEEKSDQVETSSAQPLSDLPQGGLEPPEQSGPHDESQESSSLQTDKVDDFADVNHAKLVTTPPSSASRSASDEATRDPDSSTVAQANNNDNTSKSSSEKSSSTIPGLDHAFNKTHFLAPQPKPTGRWAHLSPFVEGEFVIYPERKITQDETASGDRTPPEEKSLDKEANDLEAMVDDNDDNDGAVSTPAPATPRRGSPTMDSADVTNFNSPGQANDEAEEGDASEAEEISDRQKYYNFRKARDPEEILAALETADRMSKDDLFELLSAVNVTMVAWQEEYLELQPLVDDDANAQRRHLADQKYEARTRDLTQRGINWEEPEFQLKGYQAKRREPMTDNRYLQEQDRIMAAAYGFPYDNHPSKIGKQNPESRHAGGIMTRGRTLRNQPKPTAKATEADEVVGKRQRKPVQLFEPVASQDVSRSSTPVPDTRGRKRRTLNIINDAETASSQLGSHLAKEINSDSEATQPRRRRRNLRAEPSSSSTGAAAAATAISAADPSSQPEEPPASQEQAPAGRPSRRNRGKHPNKTQDAVPANKPVEETLAADPETSRPRHILTLKVPKGRDFTDLSTFHMGTDLPRPSTASSESSSHTVESSYSFRPKRQKRFRNEPDDDESAATTPGPPRKRSRKTQATISDAPAPAESQTPLGNRAPFQSAPKEPDSHKKINKIKVVRTNQPAAESRTSTPASLPASVGDADDQAKDYRSMTKSEKMSASMKSRWANGNMAGAVEKRKATLAAKKAAQVAAEQKVGPLAPKPKKNKKDKDSHSNTSSATPQPPTFKVQPSIMQNTTHIQQQQQQPQQQQPPPQQPPHHHHQIQHPHHAHQHLPPQQHMPEHEEEMGRYMAQQAYQPSPQTHLHQHQHPYQQHQVYPPHSMPHQLPPHAHMPQHQLAHQHQAPPPPQPPPQQRRGPPSFMAGIPGMGYIYPGK